jgi:shikimate dehydrogenase
MHNSAFDKLKLDYVYLCFEVMEEGLDGAINALKILNAKGSNITFPHKQAVLNYLNHISEDAKIIGSVNTIEINPKTKEITGYNTDGRGFIASLDEQNVGFRGKKVVLCGVGGAGRAISIQLAYEGVGELCIKEVNKELANEIKRIIDTTFKTVKVRILDDSEETLKEELKASKLFINATPLGMKGREDKCVISRKDVLNKDLFVYDIVYDPRETILLKYAKEMGCRTSNGINMMIWQGAIAFKIWFGVDMPQDYVRKELFEG